MMPKDKLAVVTGAARRVGRAVIHALAAAGAIPVVHYYQSEREARSLADELNGHAVQADLRTHDGAELLAEQVLGLGTPVGVWVNSASGFDRCSFLQSSPELWQNTFALTVLSPAHCARRIAPQMAHGGVIVNISDVAARKPWKGYAHHSAAKAALEMVTRSLARELAPGVRVCSVVPGLVLPADDMSPDHLRRMEERIPLGRQGGPQDVADAVMQLVQSEYMTGCSVVVDGGLSIV